MEHIEGNMLDHIPSADAIMMKVMIPSMVFHLHNKLTYYSYMLRDNNILFPFTHAVDYP